ncbi:MAG: MBL fold metallo-hydrolase [Eggerthellaceae bacterium]|jgi:glyoxylase-like metal-dependent hydrolase (beta-lactamase superfamily II)
MAEQNEHEGEPADYEEKLAEAARMVEDAFQSFTPQPARTASPADNAETVAAGAQQTMPLRPRSRDALVRVAPHIFRIDLPVPELVSVSNSYVVLGGKRNLIIDAGCNLPEVEEAFDMALSRLDVAWKSVDVFLTHSHFDHCAGLTRIARQGMLVYSGLEDYADRMTPIMGRREFQEAAERVCRAHGVPYDYDPAYFAPMRDTGTDDIRVTTVEDGDTITVGDFRFRCIAARGHDFAQICLYEPTARILVAGDQLLGDLYPPVILESEEDELAQFLESLDRLRDLPVDLVLTGHGSEFSDLPARVDAIKAHYERQLDNVRAVLAEGLIDPGEIAYATTHLPRRKPWEQRSIFGMHTLIGQTMTYLRHLLETGEYTHPELIFHK